VLWRSGHPWTPLLLLVPLLGLPLLLLLLQMWQWLAWRVRPPRLHLLQPRLSLSKRMRLRRASAKPCSGGSQA
jgi:hypothetical protein